MKWMSWMLKLGISAVVTSLCCVVMTFLAVNAYVNVLLDQYQIQRPGNQKMEWSRFVNRFTAQLGIGMNEEEDKKTKDLAVSAKESPSTSSATGTNKSGGGSPGSQDLVDPYRVPEDAVAVWNRQSEQAELPEEERRVVVSSEEFAEKKEQLSEENKAKIFSILISRLPQEEMQRISVIMEDGITAAELKELQQLFQAHLKPGEYQQLQSLIGAP
ncbi:MULTISPECIES: hypothetical protein [unclassified Paenibacillus]|uniref:hypothetical protein n=1 Tax=unclassified Paenibacillus TaxID=185978 RepID=UPI001AEAC349|nr:MULTISPECIES: hypothetical protein [unclassified Paenibacillus]MBP1153282.1 hypothetical protein [Paenibacillus sp. PvP091]MBP1171335.1 hypothetical protein [Paenibacillus sp. PvR098]MBP2442363.1 hypothetical protein [Paenibacillus sp. PvP052]